jgi:HK97 family phage major capsid protein
VPVITEDLVPTNITADLFDVAATQSTVLALANRQPMPTGRAVVPVIKTLPSTGWVNGVGGRKPATTIEWSSELLTPEEVAAVVAIPQAYIDDSGIPLWPAIRDRLAEAMAYSIDAAILFGEDAPPSFPVGGVVAGAGTAFTDPDYSIAVAEAMSAVEGKGVSVTGHAADISVRGKLRLLRDGNGVSVYIPSLQSDVPNTLYGVPIAFSANGAFDTAVADLITGDWSKLVIGVRQDLTFDTSEDGVITDDTGKVVANAFQDDTVLLRVHMRLGVVIGQPVTRMGGATGVYPFAMVKAEPVVP